MFVLVKFDEGEVNFIRSGMTDDTYKERLFGYDTGRTAFAVTFEEHEDAIKFINRYELNDFEVVKL